MIAVGGPDLGAGFTSLCFILGGLSGFSRVHKNRPRIQITADEVRYLGGGQVLATMTREQGGDLQLVPAQQKAGKKVPARLTQPGSDVSISLHGFYDQGVRQACQARGWTFDSDTKPPAGLEAKA